MSIRLLIADDNPEFRRSANLMVSLAADIQVVSLAAGGFEAVDQGRELQPDVAVIDLHMPQVDGLTVIRRLASASPATACMAMSFDGDRETLRQAMAAGAREYLLKPFNTDEIVNAVRRVAARNADSKLKMGGPDANQAPASAERALVQTAVAYLRAGRSDSEAARAYAVLVKQQQLDARSLARLAEIFLARRDWHTLRLICERLEKLPKTSPLT